MDTVHFICDHYHFSIDFIYYNVLSFYEKQSQEEIIKNVDKYKYLLILSNTKSYMYPAQKLINNYIIAIADEYLDNPLSNHHKACIVLKYAPSLLNQ